MFQKIIKAISNLLWGLRKIIIGLFLIVLPFFIYYGLIAEEPLFEPDYDLELGMQTVESINQSPEEYPVLEKENWPEAYNYLQGIVSKLTKSKHLKYKNKFAYDSVRIINNDTILNAFCTPGGYIYVYTGIIKYLKTEDHLAGVLGHEIAHAEMRHSAMKLQKDYGKKAILNFLILADPSATIGRIIMADVLNDLSGLRYGRGQEAEADEWSVKYLTGSGYACDGAAGFFEQMINDGDDVRIPEALSTHPNSASRVKKIKEMAKENGCSVEMSSNLKWIEFQAMLPVSDTIKKNELQKIESEE